MKILRHSFLVLVYIFSASLFSASAVNAAGGPQPVEIEDVKFNTNVGQLKWTQCEIKLKPGNNPDPKAPNRDYVDNVKVTLSLGYVRDSKEKTFFFYQSSMTLVTLESQKNKIISFFLPREIVERDNLSKEPDYWLIQLEVDGKELNPKTDHMSSNLHSREALNSFKGKPFSDTDGILVPAHRSPYGYGAGERKEPPAVIWVEKD